MIYSSLYNHAQEFVKNYTNHDVEQDVIDAVIVEYVNAYSTYTHSDNFMHTEELRCGAKFCNGEPDNSNKCKDLLKVVKEKLLARCICYCINEHNDYNNCRGKCSISNEKAKQIIDMYIDTYLGERVL